MRACSPPGSGRILRQDVEMGLPVAAAGLRRPDDAQGWTPSVCDAPVSTYSLSAASVAHLGERTMARVWGLLELLAGGFLHRLTIHVLLEHTRYQSLVREPPSARELEVPEDLEKTGGY